MELTNLKLNPETAQAWFGESRSSMQILVVTINLIAIL